MNGWGGRGALLVIVGLAVLLLALAGTSAWQGAARLTSRDTERARAVATARAFAEAYGTFDYRRPDAQRARLAELTAGSLREAVVTAAPDPVAVAQLQQAVVRVVGAQITSLARDEATVAVTAERRLHGQDPASGRSLAADLQQRLICRLVRAAGTWRVTAMRLAAETPIVGQQQAR
jgi:hypothetical protein